MVQEWQGSLASGACVGDALAASGFAGAVQLRDDGQPDVGVWGRKATLTDKLQVGDRVELYRRLTVDPKVARRERFRKQGSRRSGLFANKRPGAKAGY